MENNYTGVINIAEAINNFLKSGETGHFIALLDAEKFENFTEACQARALLKLSKDGNDQEKIKNEEKIKNARTELDKFVNVRTIEIDGKKLVVLGDSQIEDAFGQKNIEAASSDFFKNLVGGPSEGLQRLRQRLGGIPGALNGLIDNIGTLLYTLKGEELLKVAEGIFGAISEDLAKANQLRTNGNIRYMREQAKKDGTATYIS